MSKREEFAKSAKPVDVIVAGSPVIAAPKLFSTGSVGWFMNGKVEVQMPDGSTVRCQLSGTLTVIGSKEWEK